MNVINLLLCAVFVTAIILGAAAQASRFCLHGGLRDVFVSRESGRLAAYFLAMAVAIVLVALLQIFLGHVVEPVRPPQTSPNLVWGRYLVGGFLFGAGMMLARGCPLRNLVRLAQGSLQALPVLIVMGLSAYSMTRTNLYANAFQPWLGGWSVDLGKWGFAHQDISTLLGMSSPLTRLLFSLAVGAILFVIALRYLAQHRTQALVAAVIGVTVATGYALTAGPLGDSAMESAAFMTMPPDGMGVQSFTFSGPLSDVVYFLMHPSLQTLSFGVVAIAGVLVGVATSAMLRREFSWNATIVPRELLRQCLGAVLAGGGAVLGLGCTIGNGLSGVAVLSVGAILGLAAMLLGAWATLLMESLLRKNPVIA